MGDLISRSALYKAISVNEKGQRIPEYDCDNFPITLSLKEFKEIIKKQPTVEAVPVSYVNQIRWERDIAVEQLNEIGCQLGQKMDDVKKKLEAEPVVHGEWIFDSFTAKYGKPYRCSRCHEEHTDTYNFCHNCGAKMGDK